MAYKKDYKQVNIYAMYIIDIRLIDLKKKRFFDNNGISSFFVIKVQL